MPQRKPPATDPSPPPKPMREDMSTRELMLDVLAHLDRLEQWRGGVDSRLDDIAQLAGRHIGLVQADRDRIGDLEEWRESLGLAPNGHSDG